MALKKLLLIPSLALVAGLAFTGCTNTDGGDGGNSNGDDTSQTEEPQVEGATAEAAASFMQEYLEEAYTTDTTQLLEDMQAFTSEEGGTPTRDELLDFADDKPILDDLYFADDADAEYIMTTFNYATALVSMVNPEDEDITVEVPEDAVSVNGAMAMLDMKLTTITLGGAQFDSEGMPANLNNLIFVDDEWQVDGESVFDSIPEEDGDDSSSDDTIILPEG